MVSRERDHKFIDPRGILQLQFSPTVFHYAYSCAKQAFDKRSAALSKPGELRDPASQHF